jgi:hypothetical protein
MRFCAAWQKPLALLFLDLKFRAFAFALSRSLFFALVLSHSYVYVYKNEERREQLEQDIQNRTARTGRP